MAPFRTILVPVDFSEHADAALDLALRLAKGSGGRVVLLHAYELPASVSLAYGVAIPQSVWDGIQEAARTRLEEQVERAKKAGVEGDGRLVAGPAADAIHDTAVEVGADLVVMGTRGLTGLKHVLLGSVAERTIRTAPCPVLTVKAAPH